MYHMYVRVYAFASELPFYCCIYTSIVYVHQFGAKHEHVTLRTHMSTYLDVLVPTCCSRTYEYCSSAEDVPGTYQVPGTGTYAIRDATHRKAAPSTQGTLRTI